MEGNLDAAIGALLNVEKHCRLAGDVAGTRKAAVDMVELCFKDTAWKTLNDQIVVLSKRRGQLSLSRSMDLMSTTSSTSGLDTPVAGV